MTKQTDFLLEQGGGGVELLAEFKATYEDVRFDFSTQACDRCGAQVLGDLHERTHSDWHLDLSLRFFLLNRFNLSHIEQHEELFKRLTEVIDNL